MNRILRNLLKTSAFILFAAILLLYLIAAPPPLLTSLMQPVRMFLVSAGTAAVSRSLNGTLEIGALEGSLLSSPVLRDISLKDAQDEHVIHIETLNLRYSLTELFRARLSIQEFLIVRPHIRLLWDESGQSNLNAVLASEPADTDQAADFGGIAIILERMAVHQGFMELALPSLPGVREIDEVFIELRGMINEDGLQLQLHRGNAQALPVQVNLQALGSLAVTADRLQLNQWLLKTNASEIRLHGAIPRTTQAENIQLDIAHLDLGEIGRLLDMDALQGEIRGFVSAKSHAKATEINGKLTTGDGEITLHGNLDTDAPALRYHGSVQIASLDLSALIDRDELRSDLNANLKLRGDNLSGHELDLAIAPSHLGAIEIQPSQVQLEQAAERIRIETLQIETSAGSVAAQGEIDFTGTSALDFTAAVELDRLKEIVVAETLAGKVELHGRVGGGWPRTFVDGALEATGIVYDTLAVQGLNVDYRVEQDNAGPRVTAALDAHAAQIGDIPIEAITGKTDYSLDDDRHRAQFEARLSQSATFDTKLAGSFSSDTQHSELTLELLQSRLEDHVWHNTNSLQLRFTADSFILEPFRFAHRDESIELVGGMQQGSFQDLTIRADNIDLAFLARLLSLPEWLSGFGDLEADIQGTLEAPKLNTSVTLRTDPDTEPAFERAGIALRYAANRLEGEAFVEQDARQVLGATLALPIDLALAEIPFEQRLLDQPLMASLNIGRPRLEALSDSLAKLPPLAGTVQGRLGINGNYASFVLDTDFEFEGLGIPGVIEQIKGPFQMTADVMTAPSLSTLRDNITQDRFGLAVNSLQAQISNIQAELVDEGESTGLALDELLLEGSGAWDDRGVNGEVRKLHTLASIEGLPETELVLAATLSDKQLSLQRLSATTAASEFRAAGTMALDDQRIEFKMDIPRLELTEFVAELPQNLPSLITGSINLQGSASDPVVSSRLEYAGAAIDAHLQLGFANATPSYQADLQVANLDLSRFAPDHQGHFNVTLGLQGAGFSAEDRKAQVDVTIDSKNFTLAPELAVRLHAGVAGQSVDIDELQLQSVPFTVQAQGILSRTQASNFDYLVTTRDLSTLHTPGSVYVRGRLSGKITGDYAALQTRNNLNVEEWRFADWQGGPIRAQFTSDDLLAMGQATAKATIEQIQGPQLTSTSLQLDAAYRTGQGEFSLQVTEGPFVQSLLGGQIRQEKGMQITLEPVRLHHDASVWKNSGPLRVAYDASGAISLRDVNLTSAQQVISLQGVWSPAGKIAAQVDISALDLSMLSLLSPEIEHSRGRVDLALKLSGTPSQPQVQGKLDVRDGELELASLGERYTDLQSRLEFDGARVIVEQMQLDSNTGSAQLDGWIEHAGLALHQVELRLRTDSFTVMNTPTLLAIVSSDTSLRGSSEDLMAAGTIDILRARFRYEALPSSGPADVEPWELTVEGVFGAGPPETTDASGGQTTQSSLPSLSYLRTDIAVNMPQNIWVQGSGTAVELGGGIDIRKTLNRPFIVSGDMRTLRGFATILGRKFTLVRGYVTFTGAEDIDPILDVEAKHRTSGYTVFVKISGKSSKPEIAFRSEPELSDSDILSLLVFGRTSDQLTASQQNSLGLEARRLAGNLAAGALERSVGNALGLDKIAIDLGTATSVSAGRYIGQNLFLFYERTFRDSRQGNRSGDTVGMEKRLNQRQRLRATGSNLGETAVDWLWNYDY